MGAIPAHPSPRRVLVVALAGAVALAAAPAPLWAKPRVYTVEMKQMAFGALPAGARAGDVIEWVNADIFRHTATAKDGSFDVDLAPKTRARVVLKTAGSVAFYCRFHPGMKGVLVVGK